jgi:hypothetical protein
VIPYWSASHYCKETPETINLDREKGYLAQTLEVQIQDQAAH